ncbi:MAG: bifunctional diaminohydroxyphosphoribosylaminopyrimidine deaminase/5-amino-6-(5-phosphoribosylamino)uracil reductase RibD [Labilithrix sp.]|nr:bifunctional diaminohydroxyphosphoribosylaminopyrimidine deaminase/5-amino-6-(5-phosphoribosylamino)uracil reductase RibD [Polyangiaceae bacterium]MBX3217516.1 bifunctional diaminohydroxyphosphoribosylaminopyrimidine deaminase/5-amino-6-(5-phosphoribosylamino)uracil reductase RibD [Labilithrix sp.]MCW5791885.1 bifunctional diaminohydroxyphosphoribosylaminopyrimidine deaminase/5-amino-6-(5-phosphoribosylamino)uracil reductase RibD [Polyangiaceae bacterium]
MSELDAEMMAKALEVGRRGDPSPNPHVGSVVVAPNGEVVSTGYHASAGQDHAELVALRAAGEAAQGATLYVTLEPCSHQGRTPPCTDSIIQSGVRRVVIGCRDPNPHVVGGGGAVLERAGIEVVVGVMEAEAQALILPWVKYITRGSAYLALKLALSLDGRTATRTGASKWITCSDSRNKVHQLRAQLDAVMVGINTVIADDPQLTVRDVPGRNPVRVVIDSKLRFPLESQLAQTAADIPTCVITTPEADPEAAQALGDLNVSVIRVGAGTDGRVDMAKALEALAAREVVSVLCEGGAELAGSSLAAKLVDELHAFIAPVMLGPRGKPGAVDWAGPEQPTEAPRIDPARWELCGSDAYVYGPLKYPRKVVRK